MWSELWSHVRHSVRRMARRRALTLTVVLTLALGIGIDLTIVSAAHGVLLRPFSFPGSERVMVLLPQDRASQRDVDFIREESRSFESVGFYGSGFRYTLNEDGSPTEVVGAAVSPNLLTLLGVSPALGRLPRPDPDSSADASEVMLSAPFWRSRFGGDEGVVGRTILLGDSPYLVAGVLPTGFEVGGPTTDLWVTQIPDPTLESYTVGFYVGIARLAATTSVEEASAEIGAMTSRMREAFEYPENWASSGELVQPIPDWILGDVGLTLWLLVGSAFSILLLAVLNVSSILAAATLDRMGEMRIRRSLGAAPGRLVRQWVVESLVLAAAGAALGLLATTFGVRAFRLLAPEDFPRLTEVLLDGSTILISAALTVIVGLSCALGSSWLTLRAFRSGDRAPAPGGAVPVRSMRMRKTLIAVETALALILVTGAVLMLRSVASLNRVDIGFDLDRLLVFEHNASTLLRQTSDSPEALEAAAHAHFADVVAAVESLPGVRSAGITRHPPLAQVNWSGQLVVEGEGADGAEIEYRAGWRTADPGYFETMGIPVVEGRVFDSRDGSGGLRVAIVNEAMARDLWPDESAIGKRIRGSRVTRGEWATIVGVLGDVRYGGPRSDPFPEFWVSHAQESWGAMTVLVRTEADPVALIPTIQRAVWSSGAGRAPISGVHSMRNAFETAPSIVRARMILVLLGSFGVIGLLLSIIGMYGVMSQFVARRTAEIGLRMAIGADGRQIRAFVRRQSVGPVLIGLAAGIGASLWMADLMQSFVFGVAPRDPWTRTVVASILMAASVLASQRPARKAARVDPVDSLRVH